MRNALRHHHWPRHLQRFTSWRVLRGVPAIVLGFILNLLDVVSTGMLVFPSGPHSGFNDVQPSGLAIYIISIVTSQIALSLGGSSFPGAFGSMLVEILPLLRSIAQDIQGQLGADNAALVPTTLAAYSLSSLVIGFIFAALAVLRCGYVIGYFPSTVLNGIIASIGVDLMLISLELTLPASSPGLEWATVGKVLFSRRQLPLLFATIGPAVLLLATTRLLIFARLTFGFTNNPLYIPAFMISVASIFWIVVAATGQAHAGGLDDLAASGWLFSVNREKIEFSQVLGMANYWSLWDFPKIHWSAIGAAAKNIAFVGLIGALNLPIAVSALRQGSGVSTSVDRELLGNAAGNILAAAVGSVPNLIVFSYTRLFSEARGGRWETFIVTLLTASLLFVTPYILPYIPTIVASVLVLYVGIDLLLGAAEEAFPYHWPEFVVFAGALVCSTFLGFPIGLGAGVALALVIFCFYSIADTATKCNQPTDIPSKAKSIQLFQSTSDTTHLLVSEALSVRVIAQQGEKDKLGATQSREAANILQMDGYSFFGTIPSLEQCLDRTAAQVPNEETLIIIVDMSQVCRVETAVGKILGQKIKEMSHKRGCFQIALAGITPGSGVQADLERAGLACAFFFEPDGGLAEEEGAPLRESRIPTFRSLRQAFAWREEQLGERVITLPDKDIIKDIELRALGGEWPMRLGTKAEILRGTRNGILGLDRYGFVSVVITGRLSLDMEQESPPEPVVAAVARPSVASQISGLCRHLVRRRKRRRSGLLKDDGDEMASMFPLGARKGQGGRQLLLPGDCFVCTSQTCSGGVVQGVVESEACVVMQLQLNT